MYTTTNTMKPLIGLLIITLLRRANTINIGMTYDFGIWNTLPEKVGKLLTIAIEMKPIHIPTFSNDFKLCDCKYPSMAMGNNIKNAAAGVGTPLK